MEKVARLLELLDVFAGSPLLRRHLALKGGTALNLFLLDVPRLSVDIDLDLIGATTRPELDALRPRVEAALEAAFASEGLDVRRRPQAHAGGKWSLRYRSVFGQGGGLEVDLSTLHRVPLWDPVPMTCRLEVFSRHPTRLRDIHEIAAGKLAALLDRGAGRDLFDAHALLTAPGLDIGRLRLAFVVALAQARHDGRGLTPTDVQISERELRARLLPLLRRDKVPGVKQVESWIEDLVAGTHRALAAVLPLNTPEREFLTAVQDAGQIRPELLTADESLRERMAMQPGLLWKVANVRQHLGLDD